VRLPATILKQCGIGKKVEIEVRNNEIIRFFEEERYYSCKSYNPGNAC
jgi:antitoxin component of MazEF toxin-antitoxin module